MPGPERRLMESWYSTAKSLCASMVAFRPGSHVSDITSTPSVDVSGWEDADSHHSRSTAVKWVGLPHWSHRTCFISILHQKHIDYQDSRFNSIAHLMCYRYAVAAGQKTFATGITKWSTWHNFGQLFMWTGANNDQTGLLREQTSDFEQMLELTSTWYNFEFVKLVMWIGANNDQIWRHRGQTSDSDQCSYRRQLNIISLLANFVCELGKIMTRYDSLWTRKWFWAMFEPSSTWPNFTFGQLFMRIKANIKQI